jgi:predicted RNA-binding Zn-ribbon protein involved in translation (DUF1610 family)
MADRSLNVMSSGLERCTTCRALLDEEDLFCPNCGTEAPARDPARHDPGTFITTHNFECTGCGASMSYDASAQTLRCPFCGSQRLERRKDSKSWAPNLVIPFRMNRDAALAALRQWLQQGFWRPGDLLRTALVTHISAVFVPYWVFHGHTYSYWTADSSQTPPGARGNWYPLAGEHREQHHGLLIGASGALTPAETAAICPFDLADAVPRDQVDLEHAVFEPFRVPRKYARPLAQQGFENLVRQACTRYVPGRCRNLKVNVRVEELTSDAVFLPVWIFAYRYRDRVYRFLLNGQSGKATGEAPSSWKKVAVVVGLVLLGVLLGVLTAALSAGAGGGK